jgi:hypothetical protein
MRNAMAPKTAADKVKADTTPPTSMVDQHLAGEVMWLGFRRHGDGKFTRYQAVTRDGRFVAVDSERNDGLASFHRDFRAMVGKALQFVFNPLKRK